MKFHHRFKSHVLGIFMDALQYARGAHPVQHRHNALNACRFLGTRDGKIGLAGRAVHPTVCRENETEVVA
jgi:hypothetical protein